MKKRINELLDYIQPTEYIVNSENYSDDYTIPVLTAGKTFILGYTDETKGVFVATKKKPIILFDDFTTSKQWVDFPFKVKSSACKILTPKENVNIKYVFYALHRIPFDATQHMRYWISRYSNEYIRYPSKETQEDIVKEFERIEGNISNEKDCIQFLDEMIKSRFVEEGSYYA